MKKQAVKFFESRDNYQDIVLLSAGVPVSAAGVTRVVVDLGDIVIDSNTDADAFVIGQSMAWNGVTVSGIRLKLAEAASAVAGEYEGARLIVYDATYTNGFVWDDDLYIIIEAD